MSNVAVCVTFGIITKERKDVQKVQKRKAGSPYSIARLTQCVWHFEVARSKVKVTIRHNPQTRNVIKLTNE